ncbi:MAG: fatty acyl-AMP ligase [Myxococcales bacterium]|nr:fatty acyl-AMP ligase [Myxococcales bacterium]
MSLPDVSRCPPTVVDALRRLGNVDKVGYTFYDNAAKPTAYTFRQLNDAVEARARKLVGCGLRAGDRVGMVLAKPQDFVISFYACLFAGLVPVPMYPPLSFGKLDSWADGALGILQNAEAALVLTDAQLQSVLWQVVPKVKSLKDLLTVDKLDRQPAASGELPTVSPEDVCFLQYTSGSTSAPKGVIVTHANLIANTWVTATEGMCLVPWDDIAVSWLPLYHDMGLIGFVVTPMTVGAQAAFIPTLLFVKRPNIWMQVMSDLKAHHSFGPNFAYALASRKATDVELAKWDLSNIRVLGCGAEPIHAATMAHFETVMGKAGLRPGVLMPAYGMAEATLAMTFHPKGTPLRVTDGFVSCGRPFSGHEIGVMDADDTLCGEDTEGELVFRGPSVTAGYWKNTEATEACFRPDGWLKTGDLGFLHDGDIYISGRCKDLIILNGRNHHPTSIEWAVAEVEGVRRGNVVAFSIPGDDSELLVVVAELRPDPPADTAERIVAAVAEALSLKVSDVVLLGAGQLPKTSSGKLQRRKTREQYLTEHLGKQGDRTLGTSGQGLTVARHMARSLWGRATHTAGKLFSRTPET